MTQELQSRVQSLATKIDKALGAEVAGAAAPEMAGMAMSAFVSTLLQSAVTAHLLHLATRSYAEHMALGDYYEAMPGLVDTLAEAYQGKYGLIDGAPGMVPVDYLRALKDQVAMMRVDLPGDSELQNLVDEIAAQIDATLYKLTFLR